MLSISPAALTHIDDLRKRLIRSFVAIGVGITLLYIFKEPLFEALLAPLHNLANPPLRVVYTGVAELFFLYLKVATWGGVFIALPYVLWEIWGFLAPGLYDREKKMFGPLLFAVPFLFYAGGLFAFYGAVPAALDFFMGYEQAGLTAQPSIREYLSFLFTMAFAFGLAFNLPVFIILLVRMGLLSLAQLRSQRRLVVVIVFIVAAILTPPDPVSQVMMAIPLYALYELAILWARWLKL